MTGRKLRPTFFVVSLAMGREVPAIYFDQLPQTPIRHLVYVVRLDQLPNAETLCAANLQQLFDVFRLLRARGRLPPRYQPPPRPQAPKAQTLAGHRELHPRRYLPDPPYDPHADSNV